MSFDPRRDDPALLLVALGFLTFFPALVGFFNGTLAAAIMLGCASLSALAIALNRSKPIAAALFIPVVTAFMGYVYGDRYTRARAAEEQERIRVEAHAQAVADLERARELRAERQRAAEEQRRRTAAILAEENRAPRERASLILNLLSGYADAGSNGPFAALCTARRQAARISADDRRDAYIRNALRTLADHERAALQDFRERFRGYRMVMCCDGVTSPTCECSRSSHRGCCSHHGGMCGCEPLPTEITCAP